MADQRLEVAEALLAKARSTTFQEERDSFVAGAYSQLGAFLDSAPLRPFRPSRGESAPPALAAPAARVLPTAPAPSDPVASEPGAADTAEVADVIDLTALEAYQAAAAHPEKRGFLVDLAI